MPRTVAKGAVVGAAIAGALLFLALRHPAGAVVARSTSPDGRRVVVVRASPPRLVAPGPYAYTIVAQRAQGGDALGDLAFEDDAKIGDFVIAWGPRQVTVSWAGDRRHAVGVFQGERVEFRGD
jgi:hypothetical protein